uniref:Putative ovule protein n=1 Tax=Solanum chacoense TaxID=4108 RepID=A0A0V0GWG7_SOLCH
MKVLRKMGFTETFVDLIWRLLSNNWYSVLINGQSHGFFHSTRGVKQGDPLSSALFILSAEVLSRALNALFEDGRFVGYGMPKWSTKINHLSYADDAIIFTSADRYSLKKIISVLQAYETQSGQKINKEKSGFFMH